MKVVQLNIWQGRLINEVVALLKKEDADFVCLQEVYDASNPPKPYDYIRSLDVLKQGLPQYTHVFFSPVFTFDYGGSVVGYGNAVMSKSAPLNAEAFINHGTFHHVTDWDKHNYNVRNAQILKFQHNDSFFWLANHHGFHRRTQFGDKTTVETMRKLSAKMSELDGPKILCGDMNVVAESPAMRPFDESFEDLTNTYKIEDTLTRFGKVSGIACDHILVSPEIAVKEFKVLEDLVSDHKPLTMEFDLRSNES